MMSFDGSFPWSLVILYSQSVLINRDLYMQVHISNARNYCLDSNSFERAGKSMTIIILCLFNIMFIMSSIKQQ
jgi:hypothetical protein